MREALANALVFFEGALVLVSHDRHLLGMVCDHFWRVADGDLTFFNGDLDDYASWLRARSSKMKKSVKLSHNKSARPSTARKHLRAKANDPLKASRQRLGQIEARLDTIGTELKKIASRLTEPTAWPVTTELMKLSQQEKRLCNEQATLESEWFDLSQQLEL